MQKLDYLRGFPNPNDVLLPKLTHEHRSDQSLEYDVNWRFDETGPYDWKPVARFDHDPASEFSGDSRNEGLILDVYRNERKERVERGFPRVPVNQPPGWCEDYLVGEAKKYVNQFERGHGLRGP